MQPGWRILPADFEDARLQALLTLHIEGMHRYTPACGVHALDLTGLQAPGVTLYTLQDDDALLGMGALRLHPAGVAEIKSMRTHPDHLGRGVGRAILEHLIGEARRQGCRRLSLETGSGPAFDAALNLYGARGFKQGESFGGYTASDFNQFYHLDLQPA
ncbi:MAG: GNAT family N-acetyltransferase [Alphaproteobacteria bacterium]|nr:GNAT family N-acetyltransferase [Alphaproteobacteria bacterium]